MPSLVSIVIPAHNVARFLPATLASARAQTYPNLEILVVDDGSTDGTAAIAGAAAAADPRVRLIRQANAGVAAARNLGIAEAGGAYVAPLDADDLWHPENVALQVAALEAAGPEAALAYAWYVEIGEDGRITKLDRLAALRRRHRVLARLIQDNFVGNASSVVMRRSCVGAVGGYDPALRARGVEGCEDLALYIALAERWDFAVVPRHLVAYRRHAGSMSSDKARMIRSHDTVLADLRRRRPDLPRRWFVRAVAARYEQQFAASLARGRPREAAHWLGRAAEAGLDHVLAFFGYCVPRHWSEWMARRSWAARLGPASAASHLADAWVREAGGGARAAAAPAAAPLDVLP